MRLRIRYVALVLVLLGLLVAAGCGGSGDGDGEDASGEQAAAAPPYATVADGWTATVVGEGIKPVIALDSSGSPGIAWLSEDIEGFVKFAAAPSWEEEVVAEGYFYGPIGLAFDPDDRPNVVWHDHQAAQLDPEKGDLAFAVEMDGAWDVGPASDPGHDGWDSTIVVAADGTVHAAGIDPSQFNSEDGVEYYVLENGGWSVTSIGTGPIAYEFNVSLALDPDGNPALSYYNDRDADLELGRLVDGEWKIETVVSDGDAGRFSSLAFDDQGRPHISFFEQTSDTSGTVRYAFFDGDGWVVEDVDDLDAVELGQFGARRNTALALDANGVPYVAFTDLDGLHYAVRSDDGGWQVEDVLAAGDQPLRQLVSLELDADGVPHLATYESNEAEPINGNIVYITAA